jgi:hypothetical protein
MNLTEQHEPLLIAALGKGDSAAMVTFRTGGGV